MYHFTYVVSEKDYWEFNKFHISKAKPSKKTIALTCLVVLIIIIVLRLLTFVSLYAVSMILIEIIFLTISLSVGFFYKKLVMVFRAKRNIAMLKREGTLPFGKNISLQFDESFFVVTTKQGESKIKYTNIEKLGMNGYAIYVYINAVQAAILPLYVFENHEQISGVLTFIKNKAELPFE